MVSKEEKEVAEAGMGRRTYDEEELEFEVIPDSRISRSTQLSSARQKCGLKKARKTELKHSPLLNSDFSNPIWRL